jgi:hypothetical protein
MEQLGSHLTQQALHTEDKDDLLSAVRASGQTVWGELLRVRSADNGRERDPVGVARALRNLSIFESKTTRVQEARELLETVGEDVPGRNAELGYGHLVLGHLERDRALPGRWDLFPRMTRSIWIARPVWRGVTWRDTSMRRPPGSTGRCWMISSGESLPPRAPSPDDAFPVRPDLESYQCHLSGGWVAATLRRSALC